MKERNKQMDKQWFVYMLQCSDGTLYTGITDDVQHRLAVHNSGKGAKYTRARRPVKAVYTEKHDNKSSALKREIAIKRMSRSDKLRLVAKKA